MLDTLLKHFRDLVAKLLAPERPPTVRGVADFGEQIGGDRVPTNPPIRASTLFSRRPECDVALVRDDEWVASAARVHPVAGPRIVVGSGRNSCADGIQLDVALADEEV